MKKHRPRQPKQKKPRPKSNEYQFHGLRPGSGMVAAETVWGGIRRAQPGFRERTFKEVMESSKHFSEPRYDVYDVMNRT